MIRWDEGVSAVVTALLNVLESHAYVKAKTLDSVLLYDSVFHRYTQCRKRLV